jgi:chromosome segregation ATPase
LNALGMGISISSGSSPNFRRMANDLKIVLADIVSFKPSLPEGSTTNSERILHGIIHSLESCADDYSSVENRVSSLVLDLKKEVEKRETLQALVTIHEITLASHETTLASHETTLASLETTLASHETTLASHEKGGVELGRRIKDLESQRTRLETTIKALSAKEADSVAINHIMDYMHLMKNFIMRIEMKSGAYLKS